MLIWQREHLAAGPGLSIPDVQGSAVAKGDVRGVWRGSEAEVAGAGKLGHLRGRHGDAVGLGGVRSWEAGWEAD